MGTGRRKSSPPFLKDLHNVSQHPSTEISATGGSKVHGNIIGQNRAKTSLKWIWSWKKAKLLTIPNDNFIIYIDSLDNPWWKVWQFLTSILIIPYENFDKSWQYFDKPLLYRGLVRNFTSGGQTFVWLKF